MVNDRNQFEVYSAQGAYILNCPVEEAYGGSSMSYATCSIDAFVSLSVIGHIHSDMHHFSEGSNSETEKCIVNFENHSSVLVKNFQSKCDEVLSAQKKQ